MADRYLVTGSTGLIGSSLIRELIKDEIELFCPVRSMEKVRMTFDRNIIERIHWNEGPLEDYLKTLSGRFDYIIHCASPTASKYFVDYPVETVQFNLTTTTDILDYARRTSIKGMVYLSSLEAYGTVLDDEHSIGEDFQGYVNPLETRSSYNIAKRVCESICHAYAIEYSVPVKIIRLTQTVSPNISDSDMRVFAQFARHAARGEDIELHTAGTTARQYIHINDAVNAVLCVLYKGTPGDAYNAAREDSYISIRDLAQFIQEKFNPAGRVVFNFRNDMGYAPTTKLRLDTSKIRALGWSPNYDLYKMFDELICFLKTKRISSNPER